MTTKTLVTIVVCGQDEQDMRKTCTQIKHDLGSQGWPRPVDETDVAGRKVLVYEVNTDAIGR